MFFKPFSNMLYRSANNGGGPAMSAVLTSNDGLLLLQLGRPLGPEGSVGLARGGGTALMVSLGGFSGTSIAG